MNEKTYYIAEVRGLYNNTSQFKIEPFVGYLVESEGYITVSNYFSNGKRVGPKQFEKPEHFNLRDISNPWYFKVQDVKWIEVTERFEIVEEYV